ncbi:MAG: terminase small subunit [Myxococcota bacterium]|nr:terminase small subunit [Myxococcota bacterium]
MTKATATRSLSLLGAAQATGRTQATWLGYQREGMPMERVSGPRGSDEWRIDLAVAVKWLEARAARRERERLETKHEAIVERLRAALAHASDDDAPVSWEEGRRREQAARAALAELQLSERRGELARLDDVKRAWAGIVLTAKEAIRAIPAAATVHMGLTKPQARTLLELIDAALLELSKQPVADDDAEPGR